MSDALLRGTDHIYRNLYLTHNGRSESLEDIDTDTVPGLTPAQRKAIGAISSGEADIIIADDGTIRLWIHGETVSR
ncbi:MULTISPECIES: hypothetical protein [unclassified Bradyrhizobium]|uniref:hypothetical protein n=1 Tax=unclassified Bradyrhizobium TaxID=2631580 RepID=UPI0028E8156F|nr:MULTISPECIES: hypothetical protein [unclassified Bradyrhizobium]